MSRQKKLHKPRDSYGIHELLRKHHQYTDIYDVRRYMSYKKLAQTLNIMHLTT